MRTKEQLQAFDMFQRVVEPAGLQAGIDPEGWPAVKGRRGQSEWYCDGADCHSCPLPGQFALAVYSTGRYARQQILSIPGVKSHQLGDFELRAVFPPAALEAVAKVIGARRRRSPAQLAALERARAARRANVGADQAVGAS